MKRDGLDPPMEWHDYRAWDVTATRPLTQAPIGYSTSGRRQRNAALSKLWTPERTLRMFRKVVPIHRGARPPGRDISV